MLFDIRQWNCSLFEYIYERKQKNVVSKPL